MTMKTKRILATTGGTALSAVLAILIATQFKPEPETVAPSIPEANSTPSVSVQISAAEPEESKPIETNKPNTSEREKQLTDSEIEDEIKNFIDNGGIEVEQNFPEPEKESEPPEPPKIEDEKMLTNPDTKPTYKPEQTKPQQSTPSDKPKHGDTKNGKIYIEGFGWVADEGGGGRGEDASDMYENGNKIGSFG